MTLVNATERNITWEGGATTRPPSMLVFCLEEASCFTICRADFGGGAEAPYNEMNVRGCREPAWEHPGGVY